MDGLALVAVVHVAVAADRRVGRPLVARDAHEAAGLVELARQRVQLAPERAGDLEVVALVAHDVEEGLVAAELEVLARRVGAERLVGLAVRVAPEVHERRVLRHDAQRIGAAQLRRPLSSSTRMTQVARLGDAQVRRRRRRSGRARSAASPAGRRSAPSPRSRSVRSTRLEGLPHLSSALIASRNGSPARTRVGSTARQRTPGPGTMAILGLSGSAT